MADSEESATTQMADAANTVEEEKPETMNEVQILAQEEAPKASESEKEAEETAVEDLHSKVSKFYILTMIGKRKVIVIIIILKVIFWVFYFYSRYKRKEIQRLITQVQATNTGTCEYEEQPAMPQPAFMFSTEGRTGGSYPLSLPAYAEEDPAKVEYPPPPYVPTGEEVRPVVYTQQAGERDDTQPLIDSNQDET